MSKGTTTLEFMIGLLIGIAILFALLYPLVSFTSLYFGSSKTCISDQSTSSLDNMISGIESGQSSQIINLEKKECALVFFDKVHVSDITPSSDLFGKNAICICELDNNECTDYKYCKELVINSIDISGFSGKRFIQLTSGNMVNVYYKKENDILTVSDSVLQSTSNTNIPSASTNGQSINSGSKYKELADLIAGGEGNYESVNRKTSGDSPGGAIKYLGKNLADMTVKEVLQAQADKKVLAVGRYQFIPVTLNGAVQYTKIDLNVKFDAATQDTLFNYLIDVKRPIVGQYINGQSDNRREAIQELAREFASIGLEYPETYKGITRQRGQSLYSGKQAHTSPDSIGKVLDNLRNSNKSI